MAKRTRQDDHRKTCITRLYDPTEGQILLDGVDLRDYHLEDLHREIGVISKTSCAMKMTARENIALPHRGIRQPGFGEEAPRGKAWRTIP